jgi:hypothetical protein
MVTPAGATDLVGNAFQVQMPQYAHISVDDHGTWYGGSCRQRAAASSA